MQFAHLVFWYLMAGIDDSESIQMTQYNKRELWAFLTELLSSCEESLTTQQAEQLQHQQQQDIADTSI